MKNKVLQQNSNRKRSSFLRGLRGFALALAIGLGAIGMTAQNSLPAPGSAGGGGGSIGAPGGGPGGGFGGGGGPVNPNPGPAWNPGPSTPAYWGSPWYTGYNPSPTVVISPTISLNSVGSLANQGTMKVIACGYDATGVWRVLPLKVSYSWNGVQYSVYVLNAWNPWTDQWNYGVDVQAYNTSYILRNVTYDYYAVLSFGTFYFNL